VAYHLSAGGFIPFGSSRRGKIPSKYKDKQVKMLTIENTTTGEIVVQEAKRGRLPATLRIIKVETTTIQVINPLWLKANPQKGEAKPQGQLQCVLYKKDDPIAEQLKILGLSGEKKKPALPEYDFHIYTDGGWDRNFYVGSYAYIIRARKPGNVRYTYAKFSDATHRGDSSPIMSELWAAISALEKLLEIEENGKSEFTVRNVTLYSDNAFVAFAEEKVQWCDDTQCFRYTNTGAEMSPHIAELWQQYVELSNKFNLMRIKVKSHVDEDDVDSYTHHNKYNNQVDRMCSKAQHAAISQIEREAHAEQYLNHFGRCLNDIRKSRRR
jgi:ribonuclease HI